ncbi:MAG: 3-deoxy-7-phosphoheptulonate synthase, partial [Verrucomicrobia bacterium]|nr:3-deoxy-7-phosphoheptulonate synthase [Verrucomicrobiota bacterium]
DLLKQRARGHCPITGAMVESFIEEGTQKVSDNLEYGLSITDPCLDWETTEHLLLS